MYSPRESRHACMCLQESTIISVFDVLSNSLQRRYVTLCNIDQNTESIRGISSATLHSPEHFCSLIIKSQMEYIYDYEDDITVVYSL